MAERAGDPVVAETPPSKETKGHRYNLTIPDSVYAEVEAIAKKEEVKIVDALRQLLKVGLVAYHIQESDNMKLLIREGDETTLLRIII